jgi:hypothetical protein
LYKLTEIRSAVPITSLGGATQKNWQIEYEKIALKGVDALKMATYFLQVDLGRLVDNKEVVKAREVGAGGGTV